MTSGATGGLSFEHPRHDGDGREWHFRQPGDESYDSWDPAPLTYACETIAHDRRKRMTRIHLVFAYPRIPDGVGEVVEYAESLASDYGLNVECAAKDGMITVTFERIVGQR
jgi:hypothetical protein